MQSSEFVPDITQRMNIIGSMNDTPPNNSVNETIVDQSPEETIITLVSSDQVRLSISKAAAKGSGLIENALSFEDDNEDFSTNDSKEYGPIDIPRVKADCLKKVIQFLRRHAVDPMPSIQLPLAGNSLEVVVDHPWYEYFVVSMEQDMLLRVMEAANYMEIPPLHELGALWCALQMAQLSPEQIRPFLNLEEAQVLEDPEEGTGTNE